MFCDLHVSLNNPSSGGYKFVEFVLLYIYFVVFSLWPCVVYDSNFDLHLKLQYSKGNKEDITMTYIIRGSVLRLADNNLSMYIELIKL